MLSEEKVFQTTVVALKFIDQLMHDMKNEMCMKQKETIISELIYGFSSILKVLESVGMLGRDQMDPFT